MTLVESMKSGQVKVSWLSDEDIEKKRVSGSTVVCYFTLNLLNSFLSGTDDNTTDDNTTRARDHPVMM